MNELNMPDGVYVSQSICFPKDSSSVKACHP